MPTHHESSPLNDYHECHHHRHWTSGIQWGQIGWGGRISSPRRRHGTTTPPPPDWETTDHHNGRAWWRECNKTRKVGVRSTGHTQHKGGWWEGVRDKGITTGGWIVEGWDTHINMREGTHNTTNGVRSMHHHHQLHRQPPTTTNTPSKGIE